MRRLSVGVAFTASVVLSLQVAASAQEDKRQVTPVVDEDHALVLEIGGVVEWEGTEHAVHGGGALAFEVTPIENTLELEIGIAAVPADGGVEMPVDVLFKKPWRFSPKFEFMIGAGPEIVHSFGPIGAPSGVWKQSLISCSGPAGTSAGMSSRATRSHSATAHGAAAWAYPPDYSSGDEASTSQMGR